MQSTVALLFGPHDFHPILPFGDCYVAAIPTLPPPFRLDHDARRVGSNRGSRSEAKTRRSLRSENEDLMQLVPQLSRIRHCTPRSQPKFKVTLGLKFASRLLPRADVSSIDHGVPAGALCIGPRRAWSDTAAETKPAARFI